MYYCFLDLANEGAGITRKRTLTKSLRDSFRRLKSRRGSSRKSRRQKKADANASSPGSPPGRGIGVEVSPAHRLIDESRVDDDLVSMVRCLYFGDTFLGDGMLI